MTTRFICSIVITSCLFLTPFFAFAESTDTATFETPAEIKVLVNEEFKDIPVMITIAQCESTFRQFTDSGNVFRDASGRYVGIFQIDENIHRNAGLALGFNIMTVEGNIRYAKHLYKKEGSRPWANCAKKYVAPTSEASDDDDIHEALTATDLGSGMCPKEMQVTQTLRNGSRDPKNANGITTQQVKLLQTHINRILKEKYNEAAGPVDGIFGSKTKLGVQRLQTALNEVLKPKPLLVIDGIVGPFTRAAINDSCGDE